MVMRFRISIVDGSLLVLLTVVLFLLLNGRGHHPLAQAPPTLRRFEGTATRVGPCECGADLLPIGGDPTPPSPAREAFNQ